MGLTSGLNAAASGLRGQSMRMAAHSQNLASAGTIAGKKRFAYLSSVNSDSSTSFFTPAGIQGKPMINIARTGSRINVDNPLHMALTGESFFVVSTNPSNTNPGDFQYTKTGSFFKDARNNVVNHLGQYLRYFPYDLTAAPGTFANPDTSTIQSTRVLNVQDFSGMPQASTQISIGASLPGSLAVGAASARSQTMTVYDALGGNHTLTFTWQKTAQGAATQTWRLQVTTATTGATISAPYVAGADVVFDGQGRPTTFNGGAAMPNIAVDWGNGAANSSIALNLGTAGASNGITAGGGNQFFINSVSTNGYRAGLLKDVLIDRTGDISITFDSGAAAQRIGRIPIATFPSTDSLLEIDGNSYMPTAESGDYLLQFPGIGGKAGDLLSGQLEESTVDAADVFGEMIVDSKRYTANLKTISTISNMLDALERSVL